MTLLLISAYHTLAVLMPIEMLCQRSSAFKSLDNGCWTMEEIGFPRSKKMCLGGTCKNILGPLEPFVFREKILRYVGRRIDEKP